MATTDEFVKYDIRFFEEFIQYLDFTDADIRSLRKAVEMGLVQRERLVELAISAVNGVAVDSTHGQDHADGTDTKTVVSAIRNNNIAKGHWTHSFNVRKIASKNGPLRVVAYNKLLDKFHYFFIPHEAFQHCSSSVEIIVEYFSGRYNEPNFTGMPNITRKWWQYEVPTFEMMCTTTPKDVQIKPNLPKYNTLIEELFDV